MKASEAAKLAGLKPVALRNHIRSGELKATRSTTDGRRTYSIRRQDLNEWMKARKK